MSSNGSPTRLPPLTKRPSQPLANTSTTNQQTAPQNVPTQTQSATFDRRSSNPSQPASTIPTSPVMAEPAPGSSSRASRPLGVHSILNPAQGDENEKRGRRRSAAEMEAGAAGTTSPPATGQVSSRPSSSDSDGFGAVSPINTQGAVSSIPRRILTPISPTIHRAASLNRLPTGPISTGTAPTGTIDAHQSPFIGDAPTTRLHTGQPGPSTFPPLAPPQLVQEPSQRYSMPQATTPPIVPQPIPRRQSSSSVVHSHSTRASPAPTFQSYTRSGQASPTVPHPPSSVGTPLFGASPALGPVTNVPPLETEQTFGIPASSASQTYQLFSIETGKGPVQFPVEIQAASRVADEKRKRNAGASARFRARRKEKEREASAKIHQLEQQVREALEEVEWYKKERDELMGVLRTVPGGERYLTREKSPKARREEDAQRTDAPFTQQALPQSAHYSFERPPEPERNIRRRTESYTLPPSASSATPPRPYYASGQYQHEAQPSRQLTPLQSLTPATSGGGPPSILARPAEPYDSHPRPLDPAWPPRTGTPR